MADGQPLQSHLAQELGPTLMNDELDSLLEQIKLLEKRILQYCGYANGVLAWSGEIGARTEQYWCPIKHALRMKSTHSRYRMFFDYGDAEHYRQQIETMRRSFEDIAADAVAERPRPDVS